jgi:hypothetical protein
MPAAACGARSWGVGPGVKFSVGQQVEGMHGQTQFRECVVGRFVGDGRFHAPLRAAKAFIQRTCFVGVAQFAQEPANIVGLLPGPFDLP